MLLAVVGGHQHVDLGTNEFEVFFPRDLVLKCHQALETLLDHFLRDLVFHRGGRGAFADGVLEGEGRGEPCFAHNAQGLLEVLFGLARESHNDVGADSRVRDLRSHALENSEELRRAVAAAHRLEDSVRTGLQGHVQLRRDGRRLGHGVDDVVSECGGVRAGEANALETLDGARSAQEFAEGETVAELHTVGVDVLTEEGDLDRTIVNERLDLGENITGTAVFFLTAQRRNDAERTGVVAADRDRDPATVGRLTTCGKSGGEHLKRLEDLQLRFPIVTGAFEERRQCSHVVGSEDNVDPRRLFQDGRLVFLREAAAHSNLHSLVTLFDRSQHAKVSVELVVGVLANRAGVDDHNVGVDAHGTGVPGGLE